jgi:hypothetical protein
LTAAGFFEETIMRMFANAGMASLLSTVASVWTPGLAGPDVSWSSDSIDYAEDACMDRAQAAFARAGWVNIHRSGQPPLATVAHKEPLVAVIMCVDRVVGPPHSVAVVFVAGGEGDRGSNERDRLQAYMAR